jgi:hypothetical protein
VADGATAADRRHGRAFGLDVYARFDVPGLPPRAACQPVDRTRCVVLDLARRRELTPSDGGYLLEATGYGSFLVSADGARVACAPEDDEPWRWQRYLVGQVLPLVAVLHGFEVFHASVVALGSEAFAFVGPSRAGKSTIAAALTARGARLVADDVLVVHAGDDPPRAWPGFGLTSVRHDALGLLPPATADRLGPPIGADADAVRIAVDVAPAPLRLAGIFFLERAAKPGQPPVEDVAPVHPRLLFGASYNLLVRTPERRIRHLDVCARLARSVPASRIAVRPGISPADIAAAVEARVSSGVLA